MDIYLDFDGTVVEHKYPSIGEYNSGAFEVVKKLISAGHNIILNTYRVELSVESFKEAHRYLCQGLGVPDIEFTRTKKHPIEWDFNLFRDLDEIHIDDCGPKHPMRSDKAMINWKIIDLEFQANGIY